MKITLDKLKKSLSKKAFSLNFRVEMWITCQIYPQNTPKMTKMYKNKRLCIIIYLWICG